MYDRISGRGTSYMRNIAQLPIVGKSTDREFDTCSQQIKFTAINSSAEEGILRKDSWDLRKAFMCFCTFRHIAYCGLYTLVRSDLKKTWSSVDLNRGSSVIVLTHIGAARKLLRPGHHTDCEALTGKIWTDSTASVATQIRHDRWRTVESVLTRPFIRCHPTFM